MGYCLAVKSAAPISCILIEDQQPSLPIESFAESVEAVLRTLGDDLPPIFFQRCKIECLAEPRNCQNSLELLAGRLSHVFESEAIGPFGRSPSFFGVRFRFLPEHSHDDDSEDRESLEENGATQTDESQAVSDTDTSGRRGEEGYATVRFETYSKEPKKVWMEVQALELPTFLQSH